MTTVSPSGICGPKEMGANYEPSHCDKSCGADKDCKFTCGCGAINKNEICYDEGVIYDCVDHQAKCEEGQCVIGEEILPAEVTITTDKTEYQLGENIKITVTNHLSEPICFGRKVAGCDWMICLLEKYLDGKWQLVKQKQPCQWGEDPDKIDETTTFNWDQRIRVGDKKMGLVGAGNYRFKSEYWPYSLTCLPPAEETVIVISNKFQISGEQCTVDSECKYLDCSKYDTPIIEGYKPYCVDNICKCMCHGCE